MRLSDPTLVRATLRTGRVCRGAHYDLRWRADDRPPCLALVMSRKVGTAVVRNTMKRIAREWFRARIDQLPRGTYVLRGLPGQSGTRESWWNDLHTIQKKLPCISLAPT